MEALTVEGFVLLGGPLGAEEVLLIVQTNDEETVRARLSEDPWSRSGHLETGRIDSWTILLNSQRL
jgi:hypothetical protein